MPAPKGYKAVFIKFMSFFDGTTYEGDPLPAFSVKHLLSITDIDVVQHLTLCAYKKPKVQEGDKPKPRASTIRLCKKAISHYMPHHAMTWDDINQKGNPTKSATVNALIKKGRAAQGQRNWCQILYPACLPVGRVHDGITCYSEIIL